VVHTASPYYLNVVDPVKEFLDPAIKGTTGVLKSIKAHAPTVKRVVITSSSAAMLNPPNHSKVYDENSWASMTWEEALIPKNTYRGSKVSPVLTLIFPNSISISTITVTLPVRKLRVLTRPPKALL
jgi:nucleoside-diphosphate-sugar epimerase